MSMRDGSAGTPTWRWRRARALPLPLVLLLLLLSAPLLLGAGRASPGKSKCPEQQFFPRGGNVKALCDAHYPRGGDRRGGSNWFVMFFAPWCGHCQRLHPTFTELAGAASGWARFGAVDCTQQEAASTCRENGVRGYPALKLVKPDGVVEDYRGPRELPQLMAFLHGHVEAVGNNQLGKKKRERQQRRREEEEAEQQAASGDGGAVALRQLQRKCKDSAWFYSPKQHHVYNLCDGFFPPAVAAAVGSGDSDVGVAAAGQRSMLDGGRGRDIWWVQFYAPYSTASVDFKKEYKAWAKELHALHTSAATAAKGGTDGTGSGGNGNGGEDPALASVAAAVHLGAVNCDDHRDLCAEMLGTVDEVAFPTIKVYGPDGVPRDYARAYDLRALAEFTAQVFLPHARFRAGHSGSSGDSDSGGAVAGASDAAAGHGGGAQRDGANKHASMFAAFAAKLRARGIDMAPAAARRLFDEKMRKAAAAATGNEKGEL